MMSPRKTPLTFVTVGLLVSGALLGQEVSTGQVDRADFAKMQEAIASQREALAAQQKQLEIQQQEIQELKSLLRKQLENQTESPDSTGALVAGTNGAVPTAAVRQPATTAQLPPPSLPKPAGQTPAGASTIPPADLTSPVPPDKERVPSNALLNDKVPDFTPGQEFEKVKSDETAIEIGPATVRFGGYIALTSIWRSTTSGGGTGTKFNSFPFPNTVLGNDVETRLSAQATRLSLRVDAPFPDVGHFRNISGYIEADFNGTNPGNVALSSTSVGFRLRQAFAEVQYGDSWFVVGGQAFSLITPQKDQISVWPGDQELTQAVDTSYVAGMVQVRLPQLRVTWRPKKSFNWAFSVENPEQQVGFTDIVVFPTCCATDLAAQYNTGADEFKTPNLMPDFHSRIAFNSQNFHLDFGGVLRVFHHKVFPFTDPYKWTQVAGGGNLNVGVKFTKTTKLIVQGAYGVGIGRYIGAMFPDVVIRPNLTINPLPVASWVTGIEQGISKNVSVATYYSGGWAQKASYWQPDGTYIGYGFPGSPDLDNRQIQEATLVATWRIVKTENRGSVQFASQFSWLQRTPYYPVRGPFGPIVSEQPYLWFSQIRYNLP
jgi:hypothetical protein